MNLRANILTVLALVIMGLGALLVGQLASRQTLDRPGVKLSSVPLIGVDGRLVRSNSVALPSQLDGYRFETIPVSDIELSSLPADTMYGRGRYYASNGWTQLNIVLMGTDRTSIHRPDYCLTGVGWKVMNQREQLLAGNGKAVPRVVQRFDCRLRTEFEGKPVEVGGVYVFWFVSRDKQTASHWQRQWWMIRDLVTHGVLQRWAYISFFAPCRPGAEDEAFRRVTELIQATAPYFEVTNDMVSR